MKITYLFRLKDPIRLEDHWPISIMGGELRIKAEGGLATAFEVSFTGQPVNLAPAWVPDENGPAKGSIVIRDSLLPFVRMQLQKALTYIQCYFDVEILVEEPDISYEGESERPSRPDAGQGGSPGLHEAAAGTQAKADAEEGRGMPRGRPLGSLALMARGPQAPSKGQKADNLGG